MSNGPQDVLRILEALHTLFVRTGDSSVGEAIELAIRAVNEMCFDASPQLPLSHNTLLRGNVRTDGIQTLRKSPIHQRRTAPEAGRVDGTDGPEQPAGD